MRFFRPVVRARAQDLEPVEKEDSLLPAKSYDAIEQMQREYGNQAVAHWIEQRALFRRLSPGEQREQTESRAERIREVLEWAKSNPPGLTPEVVAGEAAEHIAAIFGLPEQERVLARRYGMLLTEIGAHKTLAQIECSPEFEDRIKTTLQLVLQTLVRKP